MKQETLSREKLVDQLCADPANIPEENDWQKSLFAGDWVTILNKHPELAEYCNWDLLTGSNWSNLLRIQPQFIDRCPVDKLNGNDISFLLGRQPQLHTRFSNWKKIDPVKIALLLINHPELATAERTERLDTTAWGLLLRNAPDMAKFCDWKKISSHTWARLLETQPQLICYWEPELFPDLSDRRYALRDFYNKIFHSRKRDWDVTCMLNELTKIQDELERPDRHEFTGLFKICDESDSAETFIMISMMNPHLAGDFLQKKIRQNKWELIRKITRLKKDLLFKLLDTEKMIPYFIMNAPADLALFAIQESGSFAGEHIDSCKCNCFHALFIRIAETDPKLFAAPSETVTALYNALINAGCDPEHGNLQHHSFHSLAEEIRKSIKA